MLIKGCQRAIFFDIKKFPKKNTLSKNTKNLTVKYRYGIIKRCAKNVQIKIKKKGNKMKTNKAVINALKIVLHIVTSISIFIIILLTNQNQKNDKFAIQEVTNTENNQEVAIIEPQEEQINISRQKEQITSRNSISRKGKSEHLEEIIAEQEENTKNQYTSIEEVEIFREMDLTIRTGLSKEDFKILISNVKYDNSKFFYENSDYIYDLCEEYQINEIFFCGLISAESGWEIASNHRRTYNYISLMTQKGLIQFDSVEDGLESAAKALHNNYLTEGGCFYNGKTLYGVKTKFCPASSTWVELVYGRMQQIINCQ